MNGETIKDKIRKNYIIYKIRMDSIVDILKKNRLRRFEYVLNREKTELVR